MGRELDSLFPLTPGPTNRKDTMSEAQPEPVEPNPLEPDEPPESSPDTEEEEAAEESGGGEQPDEPAQPEPETEPPQVDGMTPEEFEARYLKAEKRWNSYAKFAEELWAEDVVNLLQVRFSPSAPPGFLHAGDAGHVAEDDKA